MKNLSYSLTFIFLLIYSGLNSQSVLTLEACYDLAEKNYPLLNQSELIQKMDGLKSALISKNFLPVIDLDIQGSLHSDVTELPFDKDLATKMNLNLPELSKDKYRAGINIKQLIWDGGVSKKSKEIESIETKIKQQDLSTELYKIKDRVNQLFFNKLLLDKQINILAISRENIKNNIKRLNDLVNQGIVLKSNLETLEAEHILISQKINGLGHKRKALLNMLSYLIGIDIKPDQKFELNDSFSGLVTPQIDRSEIKSLELQRYKQDAIISRVDASKLPKVFGSTEIGYGRPALNMLSNDFETFYIIGLKIHWNIWDWNKKNTRKEMLYVKSSMIQNIRLTFEHNIMVKYQEAIEEINKYESFLEQDKSIIQLRTSIRNTAEEKLKNGILTSTDYITELNKETQSKLNFEYHKTQLDLAKINLKYLLGHL